jgi:hypothetical protein
MIHHEGHEEHEVQSEMGPKPRRTRRLSGEISEFLITAAAQSSQRRGFSQKEHRGKFAIADFELAFLKVPDLSLLVDEC